MIVVPLPDCRPPVQLILVLTVKFEPPVSVPELISKFAAVTAALNVTVPPLTRPTPAPVKLAPEPSVKLPAPNAVAAPLDASKVPVDVPPPPVRLIVPVCACTVPVLVSAMLIVLVPVPEDLRSVPALLKVDAAPTLVVRLLSV